MKSNQLSGKQWLARIILAVFFLGVGSLIILVFSPWRPLLASKVLDYIGRIALALVLLLVIGLSYRVPRLQKYRQIVVALLILTIAVSMDIIFGRYLLEFLKVSDKIPSGWAVQKLNEGFIVISTILVLNAVFGGTPGSIFIQRGKLKQGLTIGIIAFVVAAAGSIPMATLFNAKALTMEKIISWAPWLLIYVLVNGLMEELMFRGLFLRKLEPFFGKFLSNFLIAFVFTGLHATVTYSADNMIFVAVVFPLALAWGYVMQKTDSIWGSALFHAGMDIPIMLGIFSNL